MANGLNRYLHGSVWGWLPSERALIISNDEHNIQNAEVICLSVSGTQNGASVCVDKETFIQCNQIHMIEKKGLVKFEGAVSAPILAATKVKISALLNMNAEPGNFQPIRDTAVKLIGQLAKIDTEYVSVVPDTTNELQPLNAVVETKTDTTIENISPPETKPARKQRRKKAKK